MEFYGTLLSDLHDVVDLLPEGESCEETSNQESEEENATQVSTETRPVRTLHGKTVIRPNRLDL